ncbi:pyrimidine utilization regulatory protein R [compost metagenome]
MIIEGKRTRNARRSGQATREQLLETAAILFARKGLHGVTLAEIAGEAGMSGPAIYNHFRSKDALFVEVVCQMYEEEIEAFKKVLDPLDSLQQALRELFELVPRLYRDDSVLQLLGLTAQLEAVRNPTLFGAVIEAAARRDQVAVDLVRRAQQRGEVPAHLSAHEVGAMVIALFVGALGYRSLHARGHEDFVSSLSALCELLEMGLPAQVN